MKFSINRYLLCICDLNCRFNCPWNHGKSYRKDGKSYKIEKLKEFKSSDYVGIWDGYIEVSSSSIDIVLEINNDGTILLKLFNE